MKNNSFYHPIILPGLKIPGNIFLAPMAGYTDKSFRNLCIKNGAAFTYTEMVSCEAIVYKSTKTNSIMEQGKKEKSFAIQIFTAKYDIAAKAIKTILEFNPSIIDLNCGCPVPKIIKNGAGSALMRTPEKIADIIKAVKDQTDIPVTIKIRSGWDHDSINYKEVAETAQKAGASIITIHPRTKSQGYSGLSNWDHLADLKKNSEVPIIGSGDLYTAEDAFKMFNTTNCDGIMVARGAIGNPFIFNQIKKHLKGKKYKLPTESLKVKTALHHLKECISNKGELTACREMKKQLCAYTKGVRNSSSLRNKLVRCENKEDYLRIFKEYFKS